MTDRPDAVLFDIDHTVCRYRRTGEEILPAAFERVGVEPFFTDADFDERYDEFVDESIGVDDLRERCFAAIAADRGRDPELGREVARAYAAERDHTNVEFLPGVQEALDRLSERYPLAAVTNGDPWMQSQKVDALGLDAYFETVVHAGYDAPAKPDPEPFRAALSAVGGAGRAVHVGNSLSTDVRGARAAGLDAAWLHDGTTADPEPKPDYVLDSPEELLDEPWL
ncbi:MAG: HAD family hydrolase [Haloarculaceae archaeon]